MSETARKRRPDAVLFQLPEDRQLEIYHKLDKEPVAAVRTWLRKDGIVIGETALRDFWQHWSVELRFQKAEISRQQVVARVLAETPSISMEEVETFADMVFMQTTAAEGDLSGYVKLRRITEGAKRTKLESRRIAMLEKKAEQLDKLEKTLNDETLTMEQRQAKMKEVFGVS